MNKLLLFCCLVSFALRSFGQIDSFDLSKFKLPELKREELSLNLTNKNQVPFQSWNDTSNFFNTKYSVFSKLDLGSYYDLYISNSRQQSAYSVGTRFSFIPINYTSQNNNNEESRHISSNQRSYNIFAGSRNRFYFGNRLFFELAPSVFLYRLGANGEAEYRDGQGELTYTSKGTSYSSSVFSNVDIGIGAGRIEPVSDAQMALFILKDLKSIGRLEQEPTHDDIYELARLISVQRSRRFFDNRIMLINQVKAIDSLLTSKGLVNEIDVSYFSAIYDNWLYAHNASRASGYRIAIGPVLGYSINSSSNYNKYHYVNENIINKYDQHSRENSRKFGLWFEGLHEKPINHIWQRSFFASARYRLIKTFRNHENQINTITTLNDFFSTAGLVWGVYPNTRTYVSFSTIANWQYFTEESLVYQKENNRVSTSAGIDGYYYISPQMRLKFSGLFSYNLFEANDQSQVAIPPFGWGNFTYFKSNKVEFYTEIMLTYAIW